MHAHEIMTSKVHTVGPGASIFEIAKLMTDERIGGLPVVDPDGNMIGIVSETDLLHRVETDTERKRKWWLAPFIDSDTRARDYVKSHGLKAADVMSRYVISVGKDTKLSEVADVLEANNIKRVPVLDYGKLVGMITRGDLVRMLAKANADRSIPDGDNASVHKELQERIRQQSWVNASYVNVVVEEQTIELWGFVESEAKRKALLILAREAAGRRRVVDHLQIGPHRFRTAA